MFEIKKCDEERVCKNLGNRAYSLEELNELPTKFFRLDGGEHKRKAKNFFSRRTSPVFAILGLPYFFLTYGGHAAIYCIPGAVLGSWAGTAFVPIIGSGGGALVGCGAGLAIWGYEMYDDAFTEVPMPTDRLLTLEKGELLPFTEEMVQIIEVFLMGEIDTVFEP